MEILRENIGTIITAILGLLGMWGTNLINKRKLNAEAKSAELENVDKQLDIYKKMQDDLEIRFQKMHDDNLKEIEKLKKKLAEVTVYWKGRYDALEKDFDKYKKEHP